MTTPGNPFTLANWRREVAALYAYVRRAPSDARVQACEHFRAARDDLFREHLDSPIQPGARGGFPGLDYYPYDPDWRVLGAIDRDVQRETLEMDLAADGTFIHTRVARVLFSLAGFPASLSVFWIEGYGGGLFLPFQDQTSGRSTFGGGRYLYDTIKGADLGAGEAELVLDFNYAYNPSCAYSERWVCPLSPPENRLPFDIQAGEKIPVSHP